VLSDITSAGADIEDAVTKKHAIGGDTTLGAQAENLDMNTHKIVGVVDPTADQEAATKKYVDDKIGIANSSITQSKLKTTSGSITQFSPGSVNMTLPGGQYGFYPQIKGRGDAVIANGFNNTFSYVTNVCLTKGTSYIYAQQRYVQSSGEIYWVFILRDKTTKDIKSVWQAPDHPCMGNGNDPVLVPHPFSDFNESEEEIIVINPTEEEVKAIKQGTGYQQDGKAQKDFIEIFLEKYEVDENKEKQWTEEEVTVGLPEDWEDAWMGKGTVTPIKRKIPKPSNVICRGLKEK